MNNLDQQLNKLNQVKLDPKSKASIRSKLDRLINERVSPFNTNPEPTSFNWFYLWSQQKLVGTVVIFLFTFGITYGAEFSYPNNILYPIKTSFNEPLISFFKTNPESKLNWQFKLATRRLAEANYLAANNALTPDIETALSIKLTTHVQNYKNLTHPVDPKNQNVDDSLQSEASMAAETTGSQDFSATENVASDETSMSLMMAPTEIPENLKAPNIEEATTTKDALEETTITPEEIITPDISNPNLTNLIDNLEFYQQEIENRVGKKNSPLLDTINKELIDLKK
ncbi:MAG: DUF5667 domain-containing protein [Candidatus Paceibacterota bacterium]